MVLILSDDEDYSTNMVIDWLVYFKAPFIRINPTNAIHVKEISIGKGGYNMAFEVRMLNGEKVHIDTSKISAFWYRRGVFNMNTQCLPVTPDSYEVVNEINAEIRSQNRTLSDYFNFFFKHYGKHLGSYNDNMTNKLSNLGIAKSVGLDIPETRILNEKAAVTAFLKQHKKLIAKPASQGIYF